MNPSDDRYQEMLSRVIRPRLKTHGYQRKGSTFHRCIGSNWAVINFQKSQSSTSNESIFTVNVGNFSARLYDHFHSVPWPTGDKPNEPKCHWRERIGCLMPEHQDKWWKVYPSTDVDELGGRLIELIEKYALPIQQKLIDDTALRDHWLSLDKGQEFTNVELLFLLADLGPQELIGGLNERLRAFAKERDFSVEFDLKRLDELLAKRKRPHP